MPRYGPELATLFMSRQGAELLLGNGQVDQVNDSARTDTHAADGERWRYRSGATLIEQVYDAEAGAWRSHTLS